MTKKRENKKLPKYVEEEINEYSSASVYKGYLKFKKITLTDKQKKIYEMIKSNKISVITGPAGTSKTFISCYSALQLFNEGFCKKIVITKPTEIVGGSELGFLPGSLKDKLSVYEESFMSNFNEIIENKDLNMLVETLSIEFKPVQFMRGATFKNTIVIIDEFQSFDLNELIAIVTRLGKDNCKMVFLGDINQNDINKKYVAVNQFKEILTDIKGISMFEFERKDIMRDPILIEITDRYEKMKSDGKFQSKNKA